MRFRISLHSSEPGAVLPCHYHQPLSSAIHRMVDSAGSYLSPPYAETAGTPGVPMFTFSDLQASFTRQGDCLRLASGHAEMVICFYLPEESTGIIRELMTGQLLEVSDATSSVAFTITGIENFAQPFSPPGTVLLQPLSPLAAGKKNEQGGYDYLSPAEAGYADCLVENWLDSWRIFQGVHEAETVSLRKAISIDIELLRYPPQQRMVCLYSETGNNVRAKGYNKFRLAVQAPGTLLKLALDAGLGLHTDQGFGCVGIA